MLVQVDKFWNLEEFQRNAQAFRVSCHSAILMLCLIQLEKLRWRENQTSRWNALELTI